SARPHRLARGEPTRRPRPRRGRGRRPRRGQASGVIYGLIAALGWGLADFLGALASRRLGSLPAVIVGQALSAVLITVVLVGSGNGLTMLAGLWWLVVINGVVAMAAYAMHYRALELGPVSVVSPIGAAYAVVGVLLAIVLLGERPSTLALVGMGCTVVGTVL